LNEYPQEGYRPEQQQTDIQRGNAAPEQQGEISCVHGMADESVRAALNQGVVLPDGRLVHHEPAQQDGGPNQKYCTRQADGQPDDPSRQPTSLDLADSEGDQGRGNQPLDRQQDYRDVPAPTFDPGQLRRWLKPAMD
jgi:hypothetical protein